MIKKVGIFTIQSINYGNRLQNYAVQTVLKSYFKNVETINTESIVYSKNQFGKKHPFLKFFCFLYPAFQKSKLFYKRLTNKKISNFISFNKRIRFSKRNIYISVQDFSEMVASRYDAVCAGSDQIWNVNWKGICSINSFLPFKHDCKLSFSASFGVEDIEYDESIGDCLRDFKAISVRENEGANIIKKLCGREAEVLIDPTLMLSSTEWSKVEKRPRRLKNGDYILTYFLSPMSEKASSLLKRLSVDKKVVSINDCEDLVAKDAGPSEFVYLFRNASLILTDSYHACIFSFLFNKPFLVFDRNWNDSKMNSRLSTFFDKFNLERKYVESGIPNDIWEHNYEQSYEFLEKERKKVSDFLGSCFDKLK